MRLVSASIACRAIGLIGLALTSLILISGQINGLPLRYFIAYVLLPGLVSILFIFFSIRGRDASMNFLLVTISSFIGIFLTNLGLAFFRSEAQTISSLFGAWDNRSKSEVVRDLRQTDSRTWGVFFPRWALDHDGIQIDGRRIIPLGTISNAKTVACIESGSWFVFNSDEHGFNNPSGLWRQTPVSVVAVGDSFTIGYCVPSGRDAVSLIRTKIPKTINLGQSGNGPILELASLVEYGDVLRPKVVLWIFFAGNDLPDISEESQNKTISGYLSPDFRQGLIDSQNKIDAALIEIMDRSYRDSLPQQSSSYRLKDVILFRPLRHSLNLDFRGSNAAPTNFPVPLMPSDRSLDLFRQVLQRAQSLIEGWQGKMIFVYLPAWEDLHVGATGQQDQHARIIRLVREMGLEIVDIYEIFSKISPVDALFSRPAGHYSESGYAIVADKILNSPALSAIASPPISPGRPGTD